MHLKSGKTNAILCNLKCIFMQIVERARKHPKKSPIFSLVRKKYFPNGEKKIPS